MTTSRTSTSLLPNAVGRTARTLASVIFLFLSIPSLYSQVPDYTWRPFGEGLYGATATSFGFADNGNVLVGTSAGLYVLPNGESRWQKTSVLNGVLQIATTHSGTLLAGTDQGTFRSSDHGVTWRQVFTVPGQINFTPRPNGTVFAAQDGEFGPPSYYYKSTDDGQTWSTVWMTETVGGNNSMLVNSRGHLLLNTVSGLLTSRNSGKTWDTMSFTPIIRRMFFTPTNLLIALTDSGVWESPDEGVNWEQIDTLSFREIQVAPNGDYFYRGDEFYRRVEGISWPVEEAKEFTMRGFYRSMDKGRTRSQILFSSKPTALGIAADGTIWIGTNSMIFRSANNANSWERFDKGVTNTFVGEMVRASNEDLFALSATGILPSRSATYALYRSADNGQTWEQLRDSLDAALLVPGPNGSLFAAQPVLDWQPDTAGIMSDSVTLHLMRSPDRGETWEHIEGNGSVRKIAMNSAGTIAAAFVHTDIRLNPVGGDIVYSRDAGESWRRFTDPGGVWGSAHASKPISAVAVLNDNSILFGSYVRRDHKLDEGGLYRITADDRLEEINPTMFVTGMGVTPSGEILAVAATLSRPAEGEALQESNRGIYRSTDNGRTWSLAQALDYSNSTSFVFGENGMVVAKVEGQQFWTSTDNGKTWRMPNKDHPSSVLTAHDVEFHPSGSLFLLINNLVWYSVDKGIDLQWLRHGLPQSACMVMAANNDILCGTGFYGIYRIEPTSSVEDETGQLSAENLQLRESSPGEYIIYFRTKSPGTVSMALFDILGRDITSLLDKESFEPGEHRIPIDLSTLPTGTYLMMMSGPDGRTSAKLQVR